MKKSIFHIYSFFKKKFIIFLILIAGFIFNQQVYANGGYGNVGVIMQINGNSKTPFIVKSGFNNDGFCSWYSLNNAQNFNTHNLGSVSSLVLNGMVIDGWTDNSDFITGQIEYRIWLQGGSKPGTATGSFNVGGYGSACSVQDVRCSSGNNRRVGWDGSSVNILSGLAPGVYNFEIIPRNQLRFNCGSWNQVENAAVTATFTVSSSATDNFRSKTTGNWNSATSWESSPDNMNWGASTLVPGVSASSITIQTGHNIVLDTNVEIKSLTINAGATFTSSDASARTLTIAKSTSGSSTTLSNSGTWANGSGGSTVVFTGAPGSGDAVHTISGTITFENLIINKTGGTSNVGVSFGTGSSLTGTLEIGSGGYISTNPPSGFYSTGAILKFNQGSGAIYQVYPSDKTWSTTEIPQNITISSGTVQVNENRIATGSLIIGTDATLILSASKQLSINSSLTNNGTLNLLSDASGTATILTPSIVEGSGTVCVQQYLSSARNWYVSSPVSGAVAPGGYTYYQRDEAAASWTSQPFVAGNTFVPGKGYIALPDAAGSVLTFSGSLNSGIVTVPLTWEGTSSKGFNLIGNPYPSHLAWTQAFVDDETNAALIEPTIWVRTNAGAANNSGQWSFLTYNGHTGLAVPGATALSGGIIPPMQAFWVKALKAGNMILDSKLIRSHQASNPLKVRASGNTGRQIVRLQLDNGTATDEALLYFDTEASNGYDRFDSPKFEEANSVSQIYTSAGTERLVINGMNNMPLDAPISLGFIAGNATSFSIKANEISNLPADVKVFLKDIQHLNLVDLTDGTAYTFTSDSTGNTDRFSIIFRTPGITTGAESNTLQQIMVSANEHSRIVISGNGSDINSRVWVYNAVGQHVHSRQLTGETTTIDKPLMPGVYLVKVSGDGQSITRKVIIR